MKCLLEIEVESDYRLQEVKDVMKALRVKVTKVEKQLIGYYSYQAAQRYGVAVYRTPDGHEVSCTEVTDRGKPESKWEDLVELGPVTEFVRRSGANPYWNFYGI